MKGRDIEREYTRVKKSLEVLGYRDPLGLDSVSIVNKVLNDLIKTTEGFKKLQDERDKLRNELKSQGDLILPLRNENMRLTKENNELHKEMINLKDNLDKNNNTNLQNYTRNENEKEEFKLILNQKDNLIKSQQAEIDSLKQKINDLFDKVYFEPQNGINNIMNKTNSTDMYTRPRVLTKGGFEISSPLNAPEEGVGVDSQSPNINVDIFKKELDNYNLNKESWAKDLKLAGDEAEKLRNEIRSLRSQLSEKENNIETLRNKISSRDNEINSLQMKNYIGDDNKEELKIKYNAESIKEENEKLKAQLEYLNEENHRLEQIDYFHSHRCREEEINKLDKTIAALNKENSALKNQINSINNSNKAIITNEKKMNGQNITKLNNELKINNDLLTMSFDKKKLEKENDSLKKELSIINDSICKYKEALDTQQSNFNSERLGLSTQIDALNINNQKLTDENKDLMKKIKQMKETNDNLSTELLNAKVSSY